jgi:Zn-dependent peptidase ImmA (M78 family)
MTVINISDRLSDLEAEGTLSHEIGHALLTRNQMTSYFARTSAVAAVGSSEYIANCFAFAYLFGGKEINPWNREQILCDYGFQGWMGQYFDVIK